MTSAQKLCLAGFQSNVWEKGQPENTRKIYFYQWYEAWLQVNLLICHNIKEIHHKKIYRGKYKQNLQCSLMYH